MQTLFKRYSQCLLQPTRQAVLSTSLKAFAVIRLTGFLGLHIIASLLKKYVGSKVFCLNRSADREQQTILSVQSILRKTSSLAQLHFLIANITKLNFRLKAAESTLLTTKVNEIVFNAQDLNQGLPLKHFILFIAAIRNAINFSALSAMFLRITFISLICAVGNWLREHPLQLIVLEKIVQDSRSAMLHRYSESKCVAEQLLAQAHKVSGLLVAIMRAS